MAYQPTRGWSLAAKLAYYSIPEPNSGCLLWLGTANDAGYGRLFWNGSQHLAHRLSLQEATGIILPPEIKALHKCDVPGCIEPCHLFTGSQVDNVMDMVAKGRWRPHSLKGAQIAGARLTAEDVLLIRASRLPQTELAAQFSVSRANISKIQTRASWRHLS